MKKRLLGALCILLLLGGLIGCVPLPYTYGYNPGVGIYPATRFVAGPFGTYYRVDGVIVGNPIYEGRFIPTGPYCW